MHAFEFNIYMRTTIELPDELRKKCIHYALERNMNGFSDVIVEALESYFRSRDINKQEIINNLRGSLSKKDATELSKEIEISRKRWRK